MMSGEWQAHVWYHWYHHMVLPSYHGTMVVRTYVRNVMSQLSDWKRAHMCTENHVCFGRIYGSQLREYTIPMVPLVPNVDRNRL